MRVAVLPFNALEGVKPELGRQFAAFAAEQLRAHAGADVNSVNYQTQVQDEDGSVRVAYAALSEEMLPPDQIQDLIKQAEVDVVMDGMVRPAGDGFAIVQRFTFADAAKAPVEFPVEFAKAEIFTQLHHIVKRLADQAEIGLPEFLAGETMEFGTDDPDAFLGFLEGYDALSYLQQTNGAVPRSWSPESALNALLAAIEKDVDFEGPYQVIVQLARVCAVARVGTFEMLEGALKRATELLPEEMLAFFGLGEIHMSVNDFGAAADYFERAVQRAPDDPALVLRLGIAQMQSGMPVNAERNFRKALEMEGPDKPSADYLAAVLQQTGREHEVPALWKGILDENPQNGAAHAKYAYSLLQAGKEQEAERAFEHGLETLEDNLLVKRHYAPYLAQKGDYDRAMDFYEDALDAAPNDIPTLAEYAQVLEAAGRSFEVPAVLKNLLASNPDANTRAQALARLVELEQPKRVETVQRAQQQMEAGDFQSALRELKPLRNWLADYWKLWAMLSSAYNNTQQYADAEDAAKRLLELYPGCEPAYGELVTALTGQGRLEEAYQFMRMAAANNPGSLPMFINLGLAAKRSGRQDEARDLAKQIREAVGPNEQLEAVLREMEG